MYKQIQIIESVESKQLNLIVQGTKCWIEKCSPLYANECLESQFPEIQCRLEKCQKNIHVYIESLKTSILW